MTFCFQDRAYLRTTFFYVSKTRYPAIFPKNPKVQVAYRTLSPHRTAPHRTAPHRKQKETTDENKTHNNGAFRKASVVSSKKMGTRTRKTTSQ